MGLIGNVWIKLNGIVAFLANMLRDVALSRETIGFIDMFLAETPIENRIRILANKFRDISS
jgi:hypothetical protein